jgi:isoleucyl-tRNA synthetase
MDQVREVSSVAQSLRKAAQLRVRLPLAKLTVVTSASKSLVQFAEIIADELNVKSVDIVELSAESATNFGVTKRLTVNARAAGPRLGKNVQAVIQAAKAGDWSAEGGVVVAGGVQLEAGEYELDLVADLTNGEEKATDLIGILSSGGFLLLDGLVTEELAAEGLARDIIRQVQQSRKDAGLDVSDRISLTLSADDVVLAAVRAHESLICSETLTTDLKLVEKDSLDTPVAVGDSQQIEIAVAKR